MIPSTQHRSYNSCLSDYLEETGRDPKCRKLVQAIKSVLSKDQQSRFDGAQQIINYLSDNLHAPDFPATASLLVKLLSDTVHSLAISMKGGLSNEEQKWATVVEGILEWFTAKIMNSSDSSEASGIALDVAPQAIELLDSEPAFEKAPGTIMAAIHLVYTIIKKASSFQPRVLKDVHIRALGDHFYRCEDPISRFQALALFATVMQTRNKSAIQSDFKTFAKSTLENGGSINHLQKALSEYTKSRGFQEPMLVNCMNQFSGLYKSQAYIVETLECRGKKLLGGSSIVVFAQEDSLHWGGEDLGILMKQNDGDVSTYYAKNTWGIPALHVAQSGKTLILSAGSGRLDSYPPEKRLPGPIRLQMRPRDLDSLKEELLSKNAALQASPADTVKQKVSAGKEAANLTRKVQQDTTVHGEKPRESNTDQQNQSVSAPSKAATLPAEMQSKVVEAGIEDESLQESAGPAPSRQPARQPRTRPQPQDPKKISRAHQATADPPQNKTSRVTRASKNSTQVREVQAESHPVAKSIEGDQVVRRAATPTQHDETPRHDPEPSDLERQESPIEEFPDSPVVSENRNRVKSLEPELAAKRQPVKTYCKSPRGLKSVVTPVRVTPSRQSRKTIDEQVANISGVTKRKAFTASKTTDRPNEPRAQPTGLQMQEAFQAEAGPSSTPKVNVKHKPQLRLSPDAPEVEPSMLDPLEDRESPARESEEEEIDSSQENDNFGGLDDVFTDHNTVATAKRVPSQAIEAPKPETVATAVPSEKPVVEKKKSIARPVAPLPSSSPSTTTQRVIRRAIPNHPPPTGLAEPETPTRSQRTSDKVTSLGRLVAERTTRQRMEIHKKPSSKPAAAVESDDDEPAVESLNQQFILADIERDREKEKEKRRRSIQEMSQDSPCQDQAARSDDEATLIGPAKKKQKLSGGLEPFLVDENNAMGIVRKLMDKINQTVWDDFVAQSAEAPIQAKQCQKELIAETDKTLVEYTKQCLEIYGIWYEENEFRKAQENDLLQRLDTSHATAVESLKQAQNKITALTTGKTTLRKTLFA